MAKKSTAYKRVVHAYRNILATDDGQLMFAHLCTQLGWGSRSHKPGDPYSTAFNDGCKEAIRIIKTVTNVTDAAIEQMAMQAEYQTGDIYDD